jgi:acyl-CoA reductase-like NAD-dependent aldehyde dehydrogenase
MGSMGISSFDASSNFQNTINGKLSGTKTTRHGINPATGKPNPEVPVATPKDVDAAVSAAKEAFKSWSNVPYDERRQAVIAFGDALEAHSNDFAKLLTQEQGKPVRADYGLIKSIPPSNPILPLILPASVNVRAI